VERPLGVLLNWLAPRPVNHLGKAFGAISHNGAHEFGQIVLCGPTEPQAGDQLNSLVDDLYRLVPKKTGAVRTFRNTEADLASGDTENETKTVGPKPDCEPFENFATALPFDANTKRKLKSVFKEATITAQKGADGKLEGRLTITLTGSVKLPLDAGLFLGKRVTATLRPTEIEFDRVSKNSWRTRGLCLEWTDLLLREKSAHCTFIRHKQDDKSTMNVAFDDGDDYDYPISKDNGRLAKS
jgi:hypothetical protein